MLTQAVAVSSKRMAMASAASRRRNIQQRVAVDEGEGEHRAGGDQQVRAREVMGAAHGRDEEREERRKPREIAAHGSSPPEKNRASVR